MAISNGKTTSSLYYNGRLTIPMFSCVFVTVTVVDQALCWLGRENKRI